MQNIVLERNDKTSVGSLFHFTRVDSVLSALESNSLIFSVSNSIHEIKLSKNSLYYLSLSSTPSALVGFSQNWSGTTARIELDYKKLRERYKIVPIDFWNGRNKLRFEFERRLVSKTRYKLDNFLDYVISIDILTSNISIDDSLRYLVYKLKSKNIKVAIFDDKPSFSLRRYEKTISISGDVSNYTPKEKEVVRARIYDTLPYLLYNNKEIIKNEEFNRHVYDLNLSNKEVSTIKRMINDITDYILYDNSINVSLTNTRGYYDKNMMVIRNFLIKDLYYRKAPSHKLNDYMYKKTYTKVKSLNEFKYDVLEKISLEYKVPEILGRYKAILITHGIDPEPQLDELPLYIYNIMTETGLISEETIDSVYLRVKEMISLHRDEVYALFEEIRENNQYIFRWLEKKVKSDE